MSLLYTHSLPPSGQVGAESPFGYINGSSVFRRGESNGSSGSVSDARAVNGSSGREEARVLSDDTLAA